MPRLLNRLMPPTLLARRLALQSLLWATARGSFYTGSAVFFTKIVGLSATKVGLGMTFAGVAAFLIAYPAGRLVDRYGPKRTWAFGAIGAAAAFGFWPWMHGFGPYVALAVLFEVFSNFSQAGYQAYVLDVFADEQRVAAQAYLYSALNLGFTVGALVSGGALALNSPTVLRWVPMLSLVIGLLNGLAITRLPRADHDIRAADRERRAEERAGTPRPTRNAGWFLTSLFTGVLWTNQTLLSVVIPLWLVQRTDAPHWLLAWLFGTNTVLCIVMPSFTSKGVQTVGDALRRAGYSTGFFVLSCLITLLSHSTVGLITSVLVWLGHVAVTGAELMIGSGQWAFQAKLMDPKRRGEYGGVGEVAKTISDCWAPGAYTFAVMHWGDIGWLAIGAVALVAYAGLGPSARMAERFGAEHFEGTAENIAPGLLAD
ncbi:MAG: MFS transporter [Solirubrobacterales bacterium]|nr:MFS transporter [Solirubrobacterales bacterium]